MPRGVFVAGQHHNFRAGSIKKPKLGLARLIDLEHVSPLFNVPSCVIFGVLGEETQYPIEGTIVEGELEKKNEDLGKAIRELNIRHTKFELRKVGDRSFIVEIVRRLESCML